MIATIAAIAEPFFLSDRSDRSDHMETGLKLTSRCLDVWWNTG